MFCIENTCASTVEVFVFRILHEDLPQKPDRVIPNKKTTVKNVWSSTHLQNRWKLLKTGRLLSLAHYTLLQMLESNC